MSTNQTVLWEETWNRKPNAKIYALADGSKQAVIFMGDVHYQDLNGFYQDIDTALHDEADFDQWDFPVNKHTVNDFNTARDKATADKKANKLNRGNYDFQTLKVPFASKIPRNWMRGYSMGHDTDKLTFKPVGASPSIGLVCDDANNTIRYQDAWNDTDVCLVVSEKGIKETLTLKTDKAPTKFTFEIVGTIADDLTAGTLKIQPAWLKDATGVTRNVTQTLRREATGVFLDLVADITGLAFPVIIDPTITIQPDSTVSKDCWIGSPGSVQDDSTLEVGLNTSATITRSFIQFDLSSIPAGSTVSTGTLGLYLNNAYSSGGVSFNIQKITSTWAIAGFTWANQPTVESTPHSTSFNAVGSYSVDIKDIISSWVNGTSTNYGVRLCATNEAIVPTLKVFASSSDTTASNRPSLTVNYNSPPTAPVVTAPNGGETWNASQTITWTPSTDTDTAQANLQYNIDVSTDNGVNWTQVVALTIAGATSYIYDFSAIAQSSTCLIRIRAYDGALYGAYDQSNGVFTLQHNLAPTAPTLLAPGSGSPRDRAQIIRLSWQHNDPNLDPQAKFDLMYSTDAGVTWTTVTQTTVNQYYDVPASTFIHGNVLWKVRTYDPSGLSGPYSAQATFLAGDKPASATITAPTSSVGVARPTVTWSSIGQVDFQVQVLTTLSAVFWDSADTVSTNLAVTVGVDLANSTNYTIQVRIKNTDGLWSDWVTLAISVSYTPPPISALTVSAVQDYLSLSWTTPAPTGSQPAVSYYRVYKRENSTAPFTLYKDNVTGTTFNDYQVGNGIQYQYAIGTVGTNATESLSTTVTGTAQFSNLYISDQDAGTSVQLTANLEYDNASLDRVRTELQPLYGSYPTIVYSSRMARKGSVKATIVPADGQTPLAAYRLFEQLVNGPIKKSLTMKKSNGEIYLVDIFNLAEKEERYSKYKNCTFEFVEVKALPWT